MRTVINDRSRDEEIGRWVAEKVEPDWHEDNLCVAVEKDGALTAGVMFNDFNGSNIHAHLRADTPYSLTIGFLKEAFELAFKDVQARRVTAPVLQFTPHILPVLAKMGFKCEANLKDYCTRGHLYLMVMWPDNCKYLEKHHG